MGEFKPDFGQIVNILRTKSAANPALVFAAICLAGGLGGAIFVDPPLSYFFVGIAVLGALVAAIQIVYFTIFDRDRLQDEEHIENKLLIQALQPMLGDSENVIEVEAAPVLSENPKLQGGE
jgi:hypothetical protein